MILVLSMVIWTFLLPALKDGRRGKMRGCGSLATNVARQGRTRPHCFASASHLQGAMVWRVALV